MKNPDKMEMPDNLSLNFGYYRVVKQSDKDMTCH